MEIESDVLIKPIPGTMGFMASDDGVIFSPNGEIRNTYKNLDGYKTASVKLLDSTWQTFGVHRLVALAHIEYQKDPKFLTVNHIDKDITNNNSYNLEWVSVYLNNLHASLMRENNTIPTLILKNNSYQRLIKNLHEASSILKIDTDLAWELVKNGSSHNGNYLIVLDKIPSDLRKKAIPVRNNQGKIAKIPLVIKDLDTGEIRTFSSMGDLANEFNVSSSHIHQCISDLDNKKLFKRKYLIAKSEEEIPDITPEELENLKSPTGKNTLLFNKVLNSVTIYNSAADLIRTNNLSKKAVTVRLRNKGIGQIGDYVFAYMDKKEEFMVKIKEFQLS